MLIYIVLMFAVAIFCRQESKKLLAGQSTLLKELYKDPPAAKTALSSLRLVCLSSAASAILMLLSFILFQLTGSLPKPLAALSILCYTIGFIAAMLKLKNHP